MIRRREAIVQILRQEGRPVAGSELAQRLGVSRQVIVQDVALLRASGVEVLATPQGYRLPQPPPGVREVVAVRHGPEQTEAELLALVDCGVRVVDVMVEHPLYGELRGYLMIESRADVARFLAAWRAAGTQLLSSLTYGLHLHTLEARRPEAIERAREALRALGILVQDRAGEEGSKAMRSEVG